MRWVLVVSVVIVWESGAIVRQGSGFKSGEPGVAIRDKLGDGGVEFRGSNLGDLGLFFLEC